jgi:small GTP-binding protein
VDGVVVRGHESVGVAMFHCGAVCDILALFVWASGVDLKIKEVVMDDRKYTLRIWDTAGQERYKSIRGTFFRGASGAIVVYDITNQQTFISIPRWLEDLEEGASSHTSPVVMFVGNKSDRASERRVSRLKAEETALSYKVKYSEVSAKTGDGVEKAFDSFVTDMIRALDHRNSNKSSKDKPSFRLGDQPPPVENETKCRACKQ